MLGAFTVLVAAIIGFALWDRRTMVWTFECVVKSLEEDLSANRQRVEALLEALRSLGQRDPEVANVLKQFNLLCCKVQTVPAGILTNARSAHPRACRQPQPLPSLRRQDLSLTVDAESNTRVSRREWSCAIGTCYKCCM